MSVTVYRSTDSGAPVLNGTAGNGIPNLFDVCLVGSGTAYGALPKKGWTKPFTGTDKGVYLTVDGVCYLRVQQDGTNTGSYREALVRAAEGATDVDTLVDFFPSLSDVVAGNETWRVSDTLDATARAWVLIADENWLILNIMHGVTAGINDQYLFGKYSPASPSNAWPYVISVRNLSNSGAQTIAAGIAVNSPNLYSGTAKFAAMRTVDGVIKAPRCSFATSSTSSAALGLPGIVGPVVPNPDGQIVMSPPQLWVNGLAGTSASGQQLAGFFPNLWSPLHNWAAAGRAAAFGDTFNSPSYDPSAQFEILGGALDTAGKWIVELTDTWQDPLA